MTREDISEQKIKSLELEHADWGLDNNEFFDGIFFRNDYGLILKSHPSNYS
jgi:hypothetical protein